MKKFKEIDAWISVGLILTFTVLAFTNLAKLLPAGYFIVGGWQVISMIVHAVDGRFAAKGSKRYRYHNIVIVTIISALLSLLIEPLLFMILSALLILSPCMAIFYTWLCFSEIRKMNQRPLALLK